MGGKVTSRENKEKIFNLFLALAPLRSLLLIYLYASSCYRSYPHHCRVLAGLQIAEISRVYSPLPSNLIGGVRLTMTWGTSWGM